LPAPRTLRRAYAWIVRKLRKRVTYYRLYFLDNARHIRQAVELQCDTDEEAIAEAKAKADGRELELWNRERLVWRQDKP
jgi:hypothetical protein